MLNAAAPINKPTALRNFFTIIVQLIYYGRRQFAMHHGTPR